MTDARCRCGYELRGLTSGRCPECGSPVTQSKFRRKGRKKRYVLWGFLWGFGIVAVPSLLLLLFAVFYKPRGGFDFVREFCFMFGIGGLGISLLITGPIGMLIGSSERRASIVRTIGKALDVLSKVS